MTDFYQKITNVQGTLEDVVRRIPGFRGYFERQDRRAADRLLREHLVRVFEEQLGEFSRLQQQLVAMGGLTHMERVQAIDTQLRTFIDRIRTAPQGYAGVFDSVKITPDSLASVYAFDNALLAYQDQFSAGLQELAGAIGSAEALAGVLEQLESIVREANNAFRRRVETLQGL